MPPAIESISSLAAVLAQTSAEAASLHGHKAKTPMLAGAIIGSIMGAAYAVGFTIYFVKRCKRKRLNRRIAAGKAPPKEAKEPEERFILPPDPAVITGLHKPGDVVIVEGKRNHSRHKSTPDSHAATTGSTSHLVNDRISEEANGGPPSV
ncbi:hypothetical protein FB45DRAFT_1051660 [Roridomyces roridus]|uniref:Uncharacterized protein n=1 Tax=Roridomyces roridus TaxID=1738132 RepID=A0AAD7CEU1_9AGAR|nr:hypothetical protein FB45DRAFT_1051660 [Roridomyces roridus]